MSPAGIEPVTRGFPAGHLDRFSIETVIYLRLKLLQYSEVTDNAGDNSGKLNTRQINVSN